METELALSRQHSAQHTRLFRVGALRALLLAVLLISLLPIAEAVPARAQALSSGLTVDAQTARPHFPDTVDFALKAHGFEAVHAELNYRLVGDPVTAGIQANITLPSPNIDLDVTLDLSTHYIPPGAELAYHWTLEGEVRTVETPEKTIVMPDDRYHWNSMADVQKRVTVHWYEGDRNFGKSMRDTAAGALDRLQQEIGVANLERPANIWVYATQDELISALPQNIPEWVGGKAFPELALVLASISSKEDTDQEIKRVIPHELSHLVLYQATRNPYNAPPAWLDEGLAVHNQEVQDPAEEDALKQAAENGTIEPLKALSGSFGAGEAEATLSYAESRSAVDFMLSDRRYGPDKFAKTIEAFRQGITYDDALKAGLGITVDQLDSQWKASLPYKVAAPSTAPSTRPQTGRTLGTLDLGSSLPFVLLGLGIFIGLFIAGAVLTLVALVRRKAS